MYNDKPGTDHCHGCRLGGHSHLPHEPAYHAALVQRGNRQRLHGQHRNWNACMSMCACIMFLNAYAVPLSKCHEPVCKQPTSSAQHTLLSSTACCAEQMCITFFLVQNPIITLVWCCGNFQLMAPFISLTVDTKLFCVSPLHTKPTLVCFLVFTTLAYVAILTRLGSFNPLNFFNFSQWFRLQFAGACLGGVVFYTVYVTLFRRCMVWRERRRLSPS